jgi:hypothetical protein
VSVVNGGVDADADDEAGPASAEPADAAESDGDGDGEPALPWLAETAPGTSLLVAGPPMTRKRRLLYRLLAGVDADAVRGLVTTRLDAEGVVGEYRSVDPGVREDRLAVVDCVTDQRATGFDTDRDPGPNRTYAHDPGDLTGVGIGVSEYMRRAHERDEGFVLGVHTLSTMLMYADLQRVYRFVHVLTSRGAAAGFGSVYVLDESADDPGMIAQPFDGLVAVRDAESGTEVRVRGVDPGPDRWTPVTSL